MAITTSLSGAPIDVASARVDPWSVLDGPEDRAPRSWRGARMVAAVILGAGPTLVKLWRFNDPRGEAVVLAGAMAIGWEALLMSVVGRRRLATAACLVFAIACAAGSTAVIGRAPAVVLLLAVVAAHGALVEWRPGRRPARTKRVETLALLPLVASQVLWSRSASSFAVVALLVSSLVVLELSVRAPRLISTVEQRMDGAVRAVVAAVAAVVLMVVALPLVYLPGALIRGLRWLVRVPRHDHRSSSWRPRHVSAADEQRDAARPFASTPRQLRALRSAGGIALVLLVVLGSVVWRDHVRTSGTVEQPGGGGSPTADPAPSGFGQEFEASVAFEDAPWARILRLELRDYWSLLEFSPSGGWRVANLTSKYINVNDGERRSAQPPEGLGKPLDVWLLGGSVAFGAGQRDQHSVASELVLAAARDGIALRVHNLAIPATINWQSALLLAEQLEGEERPDLVVFLDGENDVNLEGLVSGTKMDESGEPATLLDSEFATMLAARAEPGVAAQLGIDRTPPASGSVPADPAAFAEGVLRRYRRGVHLARTVGDAADVPVRFFWQPALVTKDGWSPADEQALQGISDADRAFSREIHERIYDALPDLDVEDVTKAYDGEDRPIYWDGVHTNELGSKLVAAAMYRKLKPQLEDLSS